MPSPQEKLIAVKARVTVELHGPTKKKFFEEVNRTGIPEAKLARIIISKFYGDYKY